MGINRIKQILGLSLALAKAEFKEKNEGTYLGVFWYLLSPLLTFFLLLALFSNRLGNNIPHYPLYLLFGIVIFNFFQKTTTEATRIIWENRWITRAVNFPREIFAASVIFKTFFSHIFEIAILALFLIFYGLSAKTILFYPVILFFLCLFTFGISLILSSLTLYFMDLDNIWTFLARLIWFGTPIFYAIEEHSKLHTLNLLNPMYYFITIAREVIIYKKTPEIWMMLGMIGYSLLFIIAGLFIFNKLKNKLAEMI